jgi:perosamine synthetase
MAKKSVRTPFYHPSISDGDIGAVARVLSSGWLTTGPVTEAFEKAVAARLGVRHAVAVSSGTIGLQIALEALGIGSGDDVITTPMTFAATVESIIRTGARPILCDITPGGLNIDPAALEKKLGRRTRAIVPVGIGGIPCEMSALRRIARRHRVAIIEDAAHTLGAAYRGKPVGRWADATVFSFYATKSITTGEGGMIVTDSARLARRARLLAHHGITRPTWDRKRSNRGQGYRYDVAALGHKANLSDVAAALGLSQMRRFDRLMARRRRIADWYRKALSRCDLVSWPEVPAGAEPSHHLCQVLLHIDSLDCSRDVIYDELRRAGVECGVHFIPLYHFSFYRGMAGLAPRNFPVTERIYQRILTLPLYPDMTRQQVEICAGVLTDALSHHRV